MLNRVKILILPLKDGQLSMGIKAVQPNGNTFIVDDTDYKFTPGLRALITLKQPQSTQWNSNVYREYNKLVAQTKVRSFATKTGNTRPHATWKWKQLSKKMVILVERIPEEGEEEEEEEGSGDTDDADTTSSVLALMEKLQRRRRIENLFIEILE